MKKYLIGFLALVSMVFVAGCDSPGTPQSSYKNESITAEATQKNLIQATPIPQITNSEERKNVAKRAEIFNTENKLSYIYLMNYGRIMAFYTVKGKVSSLRSYMAPMEKLVKYDGQPCNYSYYESCYLVSAPDIDGTYGENVNGIFFFTTDGAYVEWNGDYMMSDQPLQLTDKPALTRQVK